MIISVPELSPRERQNWLQHAIAPRPIGLVSTINKAGRPNLAPFSFFNLVSTSPPIVIFSPSRRVRDNTTKHSLENINEVPEAVIHVVTRDHVQQSSLASCDYCPDTDEFIKAGFTKEPATLVRPFMVRESPIKFECCVNEIRPLGNEGGAGNLVIAEVLCMHVDDAILNADQTMIDPLRLDVVARLGGDWYLRSAPGSLFKVPKPERRLAIGFDQLPAFLLENKILTANDLAQLANVHVVPLVDPDFCDDRLRAMNEYLKGEKRIAIIYGYVRELLEAGETVKAWQVLLRVGA